MHEPPEARRREPERRRRAELAVLAPAALLTLVAALQIGLHVTSGLLPWKGGGFGMFASNDGGWARHAHVFVVRGATRERIDVPALLEDAEERMLALPTEARLEEFADRVSRLVRSEHPEHTAIAIEVFRTEFDPDDLTPRLEVLRRGEFAVGRDD